MQAENQKVILDCDLAKWFWISWTESVSDIYVGSGPEIGGSLLMHWKQVHNPHPIESIGFKASEKSAVWEFSDMPGQFFI